MTICTFEIAILQTASELYIMYATLQHVPCDPDEEHLFAIDSAKANAEQRSAALNLAQADQDMQKAELQLNEAVQRCAHCRCLLAMTMRLRITI